MTPILEPAETPKRGDVAIVVNVDTIGTRDGNGARRITTGLAIVTGVSREGVVLNYTPIGTNSKTRAVNSERYITYRPTMDLGALREAYLEHMAAIGGMRRTAWTCEEPLRNTARARRIASFNATREGAAEAVARLNAPAAAIREARAFIERFAV